jgi:hypothetical protein
MQASELRQQPSGWETHQELQWYWALTEVIIVSFHCNSDTQKQRLGHPEPSSEILLRIHTLVGKVVLVDAIVTSCYVSWQVVATRQ